MCDIPSKAAAESHVPGSHSRCPAARRSILADASACTNNAAHAAIHATAAATTEHAKPTQRYDAVLPPAQPTKLPAVVLQPAAAAAEPAVRGQFHAPDEQRPRHGRQRVAGVARVLRRGPRREPAEHGHAGGHAPRRQRCGFGVRVAARAPRRRQWARERRLRGLVPEGLRREQSVARFHGRVTSPVPFSEQREGGGAGCARKRQRRGFLLEGLGGDSQSVDFGKLCSVLFF